jgi:hypothetical protein
LETSHALSLSKFQKSSVLSGEQLIESRHGFQKKKAKEKKRPWGTRLKSQEHMPRIASVSKAVHPAKHCTAQAN